MENIEIYFEDADISVKYDLPNSKDHKTILKLCRNMRMHKGLEILDKYMTLSIPFSYYDMPKYILHDITYDVFHVYVIFTKGIDKYYHVELTYAYRINDSNDYMTFYRNLRLDCSFYSFEETIKYIICNIKTFI